MYVVYTFGLKPEQFENIFCLGAPEADIKLFRKEFQMYLTVQPLQDPKSKDFDLVGFWKAQANKMPYLSALFIARLGFPPTSTEVERSFRAMNVIHTTANQNMGRDTFRLRMSMALNGDIQGY